jgi:hypothetical protein
MARVTSGHSVFDQASDRFMAKTGYSPVDGTKPSVKDRFRMLRSGAPDPKRSSKVKPECQVIPRTAAIRNLFP